MSVLTAVDVMKWIYDLTDGKKVGRDNKSGGSGGQNASNGNFNAVLSRRVVIAAGRRSFDLAPGTELVVYRKLEKFEPKKGVVTYGPQSSKALATIFIKEHGRNVQQVTVFMNGRISSRPIH